MGPWGALRTLPRLSHSILPNAWNWNRQMNMTFCKFANITIRCPIIKFCLRYVQTQNQEAHSLTLAMWRCALSMEQPIAAVSIFIYLDSDHFVQRGGRGVLMEVSHISVIITGTLEDEIILFSWTNIIKSKLLHISLACG